MTPEQLRAAPIGKPPTMAVGPARVLPTVPQGVPSTAPGGEADTLPRHEQTKVTAIAVEVGTTRQTGHTPDSVLAALRTTSRATRGAKGHHHPRRPSAVLKRNASPSIRRMARVPLIGPGASVLLKRHVGLPIPGPRRPAVQPPETTARTKLKTKEPTTGVGRVGIGLKAAVTEPNIAIKRPATASPRKRALL